MRARGARGPVASVVLVLTLGQLAACTSGDDSPEPSRSESSPAWSEATGDGAEVDAVLEHWRTIAPHYALQVPGVILLVSQGDQTRALALGNARLSPERPMRTDDRFGIANVTNTMVAVVILQLEAEGALTLSDTVEQWLPGMLTFGADVTIEDLLDHRSGIWDVTARTNYDWGTDLTDRRLQELLDHPPTGPADAVTRYTNPGYWLLGKIVERATGHLLATVLHDRVFAPAGMNDSVLSADLDRESRLVRGYDENGNDITLGDYTGTWATAGVVTTAADIARFFGALHGALLSEASGDDMTTARGSLPTGHEPGYGLGVMLLGRDGSIPFGHEGVVDGYHTLAFHNPELDRTVVVFTNTSSDAGAEAAVSLLDAISYE